MTFLTSPEALDTAPVIRHRGEIVHLAAVTNGLQRRGPSETVLCSPDVTRRTDDDVTLL